MAQENFDQDIVSTSKFYMLRCLVAMAHADGVICDEERAYLAVFMNRLPFTDEQRNIFENDMETSQDIETLLPHINDPKYRGQLPYFARIMAYKDGELHPNEEALLNRMHAHAMDGLDMDAIRKETAQAVAFEMNAHDINIDKFRPEGGVFGLFWLFDRIMLALGIDLMRD